MPSDKRKQIDRVRYDKSRMEDFISHPQVVDQ